MRIFAYWLLAVFCMAFAFDSRAENTGQTGGTDEDFSIRKNASGEQGAVTDARVGLRFVADDGRLVLEIEVPADTEAFPGKATILNICEEAFDNNWRGLREVISSNYSHLANDLIAGLMPGRGLYYSLVCPKRGSDKTSAVCQGACPACKAYDAQARQCPKSPDCDHTSWGSVSRCEPRPTSVDGCVCPVSKFVTQNTDGTTTQWFKEDFPCVQGVAGQCGASECSALVLTGKNDVSGRRELLVIKVKCSEGKVEGPNSCECKSYHYNPL